MAKKVSKKSTQKGSATNRAPKKSEYKPSPTLVKFGPFGIFGYGFINEDCEVVFDTRYRYARHFSGGYYVDGKYQGVTALVKFKNGNWGWINQNGENAFGTEFKYVDRGLTNLIYCLRYRDEFLDGLARVQFLNGNWGYINREGKNAFGELEFKSAGRLAYGQIKWVRHLDGKRRKLNYCKASVVRSDYGHIR